MSGVAATDAARPLIVFNDDVDVVMLVMRHANETWELVTKEGFTPENLAKGAPRGLLT